jgi:predicted peptidase
MYATQFLGLALIIVLAFAGTVRAAKQETGFLNRSVVSGGKTYSYQVYLPAGWNNKKKWPVILFLHGAGERGEDGLVQTEVGIGTAIRRYSDRVPAVVVLPQCLKNRWWSEPQMQSMAIASLEKTVAEFNGDRTRLYLTGLSMGGYGTWAIVTNHPGKFAALAVICGGVRPPRAVPRPPGTPDTTAVADPYGPVAQKVGNTPVWVFHGAADPVVPVSESQKMVEAIKANNGNVKYSEYEGVGHNSWDKAYSDQEFFQWMLAQRINSGTERPSRKTRSRRQP